jgi:hypothetical protein
MSPRAFRAEPEAGRFFTWIRRNLLKSPNSAKGMQGNPNFFSWFSLVLFGFAWIYFARLTWLAAVQSRVRRSG